MVRLRSWGGTVFLGIVLWAIPGTGHPTVPREPFTGLAFPLLPHLVSISQQDLLGRLYPGLEQRAAVNQLLIEDLYGPQHLLREYPEWRPILEHIPGFWSELVGKLGDPYFAGFYGPDAWAISDSKQVYHFIAGEENGSNVGGAEAMLFYLRAAADHPNIFGSNPYPYQSPYETWMYRIRNLVRSHFGNARKGKIVFACEGSVSGDPISIDGTKIKPPWPLGAEAMGLYRSELTRLGVEYVSLVDERGRIFVKDDVLYVRSQEGTQVDRIDAFIQMADVESIDPLHAPQILRNQKSGQSRYNEMANLIGVPGIVKAWTSKKDGGFIWVGGPTSVLKRSKMTPLLVDQMLHKLGSPVLLPYQATTVFYNPDSSPNLEAISQIRKSPLNWVLKFTVGSGGKEVFFGDESPAGEWRQVLDFVTEHPYAVIGQPLASLGTIPIAFDDGTTENRIFDIRVVNLMMGSGRGFEFYPGRIPSIRIAPFGARKVNISGGGMVTAAVPSREKGISILPRLHRQDLLPYAPCLLELLLAGNRARALPASS